MVKLKKIILSLSFCFLFIKINAQNIFISEISELDEIRNRELLNLNDSINHISYFYRNTQQLQYISKKNITKRLTFSYNSQNNSLLPISINDGIFFPSRGWQESYSPGLFLKWKFLDISLQPEFLKVQNLNQEIYYGNPEDGNFAAKYFGSVANNIDNFRQFGVKKIDTSSFGQSRFGFIFHKISIGLSNQNLWWGPGKRNSIVFTNNAGGFKHIYFNTIKPLKTNFGNIEISAIKGILDTNYFIDPDVNLLWNYRAGIAKKNLDQRIIFGFSANFQPTFIPNFYVGYSYVRQNYKNDTRYTFYSKDINRQEFGSLMFRLKLPKDNSEIYSEIAINNNAPYIWKFFNSESKLAYILGLTKIAQIKKSYLVLNIEFSQFQLMDPKDIFYPGAPFVGGLFNSWYTNSNIKQGYTNKGQILGASIGPGSNSQTINLSWNKKNIRFGLLLERIVHNNDFYYVVYLNGNYGNYDPLIGQLRWGYYNKYWVDINSRVELQTSLFKRLTLNIAYMKTNAMNYRWIRYEDGSKYDEPSKLTDKLNFQLQISFKYLIHEKIQ